MTKYQLYYTRWIVGETKIIPAIINNDQTKIKIMDGSERIIANSQGAVIFFFGEGAKLMTYEEVCEKYDPRYDGNPEVEKHYRKDAVEEEIRQGGLDSMDGFFPRYRFYSPQTENGLKRVARYLEKNMQKGKKEEDIYEF